MPCTHPDHVDGVSCGDRAVGCSPDCVCCMGYIASSKTLDAFLDASYAQSIDKEDMLYRLNKIWPVPLALETYIRNRYV